MPLVAALIIVQNTADAFRVTIITPIYTNLHNLCKLFYYFFQKKVKPVARIPLTRTYSIVFYVFFIIMAVSKIQNTPNYFM